MTIGEICPTLNSNLLVKGKITLWGLNQALVVSSKDCPWFCYERTTTLSQRDFRMSREQQLYIQHRIQGLEVKKNRMLQRNDHRKSLLVELWEHSSKVNETLYKLHVLGCELMSVTNWRQRILGETSCVGFPTPACTLVDVKRTDPMKWGIKWNGERILGWLTIIMDLGSLKYKSLPAIIWVSSTSY